MMWLNLIRDTYKTFSFTFKEKKNIYKDSTTEKKNPLYVKQKNKIEQLQEIGRPFIYSIIQSLSCKKSSSAYFHIKHFEGISTTRPGPRSGKKKKKTKKKKS